MTGALVKGQAGFDPALVSWTDSSIKANALVIKVIAAASPLRIARTIDSRTYSRDYWGIVMHNYVRSICRIPACKISGVEFAF
jgi:hypothetical protein